MSGDGEPATKAALNVPGGIAFDRDGRLLIADTGNHRVRRVSTDGIIATIAGSGRDGLAAEGKQALEADLGYPSAVAVGDEGSLIVVQGAYGLVHRVEPDGTVRTIVGNRRLGPPLRDGAPATSGHIERIWALAPALDGAMLFVAEERSLLHVWRVDPRTGVAKVVAGRGPSAAGGDVGGHALSLTLDAVRSLAVDSAGNLYIGDVPGDVRRIDAATREIVSVARTEGQRHLRASGLLWVGPETLYIADQAGYIWRLEPDGRRTAVAGGGIGF
jgi:sugar lactone lactonase YvrE